MNKPSSKAQTKNIRDLSLWILALSLALVIVIGNVYFGNQPLLYRSIGIVVGGALAFLIWLQTEMGIRFRTLYHGSRIELRKVVWPTRQETVQSSLVVLAVVAIISLVLWLFDSLFAWIISLLVGV